MTAGLHPHHTTQGRPPAAEAPAECHPEAAHQVVIHQAAAQPRVVTALQDLPTDHRQAAGTLPARREAQAATPQAEAHIRPRPAAQAAVAEATQVADHPEAQAVPTAEEDREAVAEEGN